MADRQSELTSAVTLELEVECVDCGGTGTWTNHTTGKSYDCPACEGTGHLLTDLGDSIMDFLIHAAKRMKKRGVIG